MATITPVMSSPAHNVVQVFWETLTDADDATAYQPAGLEGLFGAVQFTGTIGTAVTLEVSNDGTNFVTLNDKDGTAISTGSAGMFEFSTAARYIRPGAPTGTSDVDVTLILRNQ